VKPPETPAGVNEPVFAALDISIGPYFKKIYAGVLLLKSSEGICFSLEKRIFKRR
jgi:hypothetical protein